MCPQPPVPGVSYQMPRSPWSVCSVVASPGGVATGQNTRGHLPSVQLETSGSLEAVVG